MEKKDKRMVEEWSSRYRPLGLDENLMGHWHTIFERENPSGYESFYQWLGLPEERLDMVRAKSDESKK